MLSNHMSVFQMFLIQNDGNVKFNLLRMCKTS